MSIEQVTCPSCGNQVPATSRFCPECGYSLASHAQATGQLPTLSPGTPTLELGSLSDTQQAQFFSPSQSQSLVPQQQPDQAAQMSASEPTTQQGPLRGGSLVPYAPSEVTIPPPPAYSDSLMLQPSELQPAGPMQIYPTFSQPAVSFSSYQVQADDEPIKNPLIGFLLELMGMIGFLGIGHMYAGHAPRGISMMIGWFIYTTFLVLLIISTNVVNFVISCLRIGDLQCITYPFLAIFILVPILSGFSVHTELETQVRRRGHR